jgi:hypothetical protein
MLADQKISTFKAHREKVAKAMGLDSKTGASKSRLRPSRGR